MNINIKGWFPGAEVGLVILTMILQKSLGWKQLIPAVLYGTCWELLPPRLWHTGESPKWFAKGDLYSEEAASISHS